MSDLFIDWLKRTNCSHVVERGMVTVPIAEVEHLIVSADLAAERERELREMLFVIWSDMRDQAERKEGLWRHFYERLNDAISTKEQSDE